MEDIVPGLLDAIQKKYRAGIRVNPKLKEIRKKIKAKTATYLDADEYAQVVGNILAAAYMLITDDILPNGVMYYNIADRILRPTLTEAQDEMIDIAVQVQEQLNKKANIGIKAIRPKADRDRITGFIEKIVRDDQDEGQISSGEPNS